MPVTVPALDSVAGPALWDPGTRTGRVGVSMPAHRQPDNHPAVTALTWSGGVLAWLVIGQQHLLAHTSLIPQHGLDQRLALGGVEAAQFGDHGRRQRAEQPRHDVGGARGRVVEAGALDGGAGLPVAGGVGDQQPVQIGSPSAISFRRSIPR